MSTVELYSAVPGMVRTSNALAVVDSFSYWSWPVCRHCFTNYGV